MRKVLILANNDVGLYNFRKEVVEKLIEEQYEVVLSLPYGDKIEKLKKLGCKFIDTPIDRRGKNPITDLNLLLNYKKIIDQVKPSVVLTYTIKPNIYGGLMCAHKHVPYIANLTGLGSAVENAGLMQKFTLFLYKLAFREISCAFFQNKENEEFFKINKIVADRHRLIPGSGVNLAHYQPLPYPEKKPLRFLFVGRLMKEKGIDQYLEAAEYIKKKYSDVEFHIIGFCEEAYEKALNNLQARNIVYYHGMQSDIRKFLKLSHCIVNPTYYPEGMSNVLLESAACGRPLITTNRSGSKEAVEDGKTGYLIEAKNTVMLISAIEKFIALPYEEKKCMGALGREKMEKEFNREIVIDAYLNEIGKVV